MEHDVSLLKINSGRAIALPLAKYLSFYVKVFFVMGKALTGELSCPMTGLVTLNYKGIFIIVLHHQHLIFL